LRDAIGDDGARVEVYNQHADSYWPLVSLSEPIDLVLLGDCLNVRAAYLDNDGPRRGLQLQSVVTPLLRRHGARVMRTSFEDDFGRVRSQVEFECRSLRGLRVINAYELELAVRSLASTVNARGQLDAVAITDLIMANKADLLVGQRENDYFDAKGATYAPKTKPGAFALAKDVAAFANADRGGLLVCGLRRRKDQQGDVVSEARPVALAGISPRS
jgi:hypothetical protein